MLFGFFLVFLLSECIFILFSVWFFWLLLLLLQPLWNHWGWELVLPPFQLLFFSFCLVSGDNWLGSLLENNNKYFFG